MTWVLKTLVLVRRRHSGGSALRVPDAVSREEAAAAGQQHHPVHEAQDQRRQAAQVCARVKAPIDTVMSYVCKARGSGHAGKQATCATAVLTLGVPRLRRIKGRFVKAEELHLYSQGLLPGQDGIKPDPVASMQPVEPDDN